MSDWIDWVVDAPLNVLMVFVSALVIYAALLVCSRLAGLRSFSKLSGFDFPVTVAFGSLLATVIATQNPPIVQGVAALVALFSLQMFFAQLRLKFRWVEGLSTNTPRLIMIGNEILHDQMAKAKITQGDLLNKLRAANVLHRDQVLAVIAETTGDITVLHRSSDAERFDPEMLDGVIGAERFTEWAKDQPNISTNRRGAGKLAGDDRKDRNRRSRPA